MKHRDELLTEVDEITSLTLAAWDRQNEKDYSEAAHLFQLAGNKCKIESLYPIAAHFYRRAGHNYFSLIKKWEIKGASDKSKGMSPDETEGIENASSAIKCFREARELFTTNGYYREARATHMDEMNIKRAIAAKRMKLEDMLILRYLRYPLMIRIGFIISWLNLSLMKYLFGYGQRPLWFAGWILFFILMFAIAYCPSQWGFIDIELRGVGWGDSLLSNFGIAFYFSIVTFATLGYGDISPGNGWAKFFVCFEVACGFMMLGALIVLIGKQITYD